MLLYAAFIPYGRHFGPAVSETQPMNMPEHEYALTIPLERNMSSATCLSAVQPLNMLSCV